MQIYMLNEEQLSLVKVRLWLGHITLVHINEMYVDVLNTSAVISKTSFEQRGMFHQDYQLFGTTMNCQDSWLIGTLYKKDARFLLVT